jgi:inhibitor of KinA sporulation pathway (predicted exonuclease)
MQIKKPTQLQALQALLQGKRYLLCVDLEATCDELPEGVPEADAASYPLSVPRAEMEVIEIGAVMIDLRDECRVVGEFSRFVKPVLHPTLTDFCTRLTTIQQADVDVASSYTEVAQEVDLFLQPFIAEGWLWCSWGEYDRKQLVADAARVGCASMLDPERHTNLKKWFAKVFACRALGLKPATAALGIEWAGTYHRGIDDARNLASVAAVIINSLEARSD